MNENQIIRSQCYSFIFIQDLIILILTNLQGLKKKQIVVSFSPSESFDFPKQLSRLEDSLIIHFISDIYSRNNLRNDISNFPC